MTKRKIVAIGGGECGRMTGNGGQKPYETSGIDEEIIRLSGRERPNFLLLAHAQLTNGAEAEKNYYETLQRIYGGLYGCTCRWLKSSDLSAAPEKTREYVEWADIVYEGGGDTAAMMGLWRKSDFDKTLKSAWEAGKVMCGISAGAICWFALGNTGVSGYKEKEINKIEGLGFVNAYFSPHCQEEWKRESEVRSLKRINKVGLSVSNCSAVEIVGGEYRILKPAPADKEFRPYVLRTYWKNGKLFEEELPETDEYRRLDELLKMEEI